jgi:hypothetical protein
VEGGASPPGSLSPYTLEVSWSCASWGCTTVFEALAAKVQGVTGGFQRAAPSYASPGCVSRSWIW